jgi:hypothetical protein
VGLGQPRQAATRPQMEEIILRPPRIGVATFNNTSNPTSGWACAAPKDPGEFERRTELASDVIWISEAKQSANAQNFRPTNFLRSSLTQIATDLGVVLRTYDGLKTVAETVSRVRDIAARAYPWLDFSGDWSHQDLATAIAKILPPTGDILPNMESPLLQSHQTYSAVPDRPAFDGLNQTIYTLRVNRLRYAQYVLSTKVPTNSWRAIPDVGSTNLTLDDLLNPDEPALVEASIEFTTAFGDAVTPGLVAFGSTKTIGRQPLRKWITQPELAWLVQHANVHVQSAFISEGSASLTEQHRLPFLLTADPVLALSVAAGLVAECHWVGVTSPTSVRRAGNSGTARFTNVVTPVAAWLRAADRAYSFAMAKLVATRGYTVTGYGYGGVSFFGPKDDVARVMALAEELGACHPCLAAMQLGQEAEAD